MLCACIYKQINKKYVLHLYQKIYFYSRRLFLHVVWNGPSSLIYLVIVSRDASSGVGLTQTGLRDGVNLTPDDAVTPYLIG